MTPPPPQQPNVQNFRTLTGRLYLLSSGLAVILFLAHLFVELPPFIALFRKVVHLSWIISGITLVVRAIAQNRRRFLWRVRRKLILSYLLLGVVPVLLVLGLALAGGLILYLNVAGYMFHEGFADIGGDVLQAAETTAAEISRAPDPMSMESGRSPAAIALDAVTRKVQNQSARYPGLSLAVVPHQAAAPSGQNTGRPIAKAGPWRHAQAPARSPDWLTKTASGFSGVVAVPVPGSPDEWMLVMRAVVPTTDHARAVIADLPVDPRLVAEIEARTDARMGQITLPAANPDTGERPCGGETEQVSLPQSRSLADNFRHSVATVECTSWETGDRALASVSLEAPIGRLYARVSGYQAGGIADFLMLFLIILGVLCLVIQASALVMGVLLGRSITYAVHELFVGTEKIQQGNFAHRIRIDTGDQLGDLGSQFNRMSSSMEHLLHVQRRKQRLDDELRIAREIQKSLLPVTPPDVVGMTIADLCEPAREVGGDYYDFFELGPRRIGVMVADVSGKGTSAALYMAELKGLMLALTRQEQSPRRLLVEANRLLAEHLDNRSFITMTYAIIDLDAGTITSARAGHTPMIVVSNGVSEVITPSGMVLGLRLPGAAERFREVLEEHTRQIKDGDLIVLYTDGITEAMNEAGDLFSDETLARVVSGQHGLDASGIRERVVREVRAFVGAAEAHDDMTMIVLKIRGPVGAGRAGREATAAAGS